MLIQQMDSFNTICNGFLNHLPVDQREDAAVSICILSKHANKIKKIDLEGLTSEKLRKYEEQDRFVVVVNAQDTFFAFMNSHKADQFQYNDLTIEGKKVSVEALSEEDYEKLKGIAELIHESKEKSQTKEVEPLEIKLQPIHSRPRPHHSLSRIQHESDFAKFIFSITNISEQTKTKILQDWSESIRQIAKRKKEDAEKEEIKYFDIKRKEVEKSETKIAIKKREIIAKEIKTQD